MLRLGDFNISSYEMQEGGVLSFTVVGANIDDVIKLRGTELRLTDPEQEDAVVATFPGYDVTGVQNDPKTRGNCIVIASQNLGDGTQEAINQLQNDMTEVLASNNALRTVIPYILTNANLPDSQAYTCKNLYPEWRIAQKYKADQMIQYDGELYKLAQDTVSQDQYRPGAEGTESIYTLITMTSSGYPLWTPPTGAHDAYDTGDIVFYNDKLYQSKINGNVYEPGTDYRWWGAYHEN